MNSLNNETALHALNKAAIQYHNHSPDHLSGKGIVICGGGQRYGICVWVCVNMLREMGCNLPVQVWHLGEREMNDTFRQMLSKLNVECVDAHEIRKIHPVRRLGGWELKSYAMLHSPFEEVLLLDSDNVITRDPTYLFDCREYQNTGAIFWPDYGRLAVDREIWDLTGIPYRDEPEFETGQILVNKSKCWHALNLTMWINEHSDFWYKYIYGDKDTFHMAWRKIGQEYSMPEKLIHTIEHTMCQHDLEGNIIFQHRNMDKWSLKGNKTVRNFQHEEKCFEFRDQLKDVAYY